MVFRLIAERWERLPTQAGAYEGWLVPNGSLTRRLMRVARRFHVEVVREGLSRCTPEEARLLRIAPAAFVYARHVRLFVDGEAVVLARSVVSLAGLRRPWGSLQRLGARPLGSALWSRPSIRRGRLEFCRLLPGHALYRRLETAGLRLPDDLPARRSLFWWAGQPLLVMEAFLPAILELPCPD